MPTRPLPEGTKNLTINIPEDLEAALIELADQLGMKKSGLARDILEDMVKRPDDVRHILIRKLQRTSEKRLDELGAFEEKQKRKKRKKKVTAADGEVRIEYDDDDD